MQPKCEVCKAADATVQTDRTWYCADCNREFWASLAQSISSTGGRRRKWPPLSENPSNDNVARCREDAA